MTMIKLDTEREIKFTMFAARRFKEAYGKPLWRVMVTGPEGQEMLDSVCLTYVVWAGLLHENPKVKTDDVERHLQSFLDAGGKIPDLYEGLGEALEESGLFTPSDDGEESNGDSPDPNA